MCIHMTTPNLVIESVTSTLTVHYYRKLKVLFYLSFPITLKGMCYTRKLLN